MSLGTSAKHLSDPYVEAVRAGDVNAFEELYRSYYDSLVRFIARFVGSGAVAEELCQDVFMMIWNKRRTWKPPGTVKSYLFKVARNKAIDYLRSQKVAANWVAQERARRPISDVGPDVHLSYQALAEILESAIAQMPERRRLVFILSREYQLTYREIADALDISVKTVESHMGHALATLREAVAPYISYTP